MTPVSRVTWALIGAAALASSACVWALFDLGHAPPSAAVLPVAGHRLFVSSSDDGVSVLTDRSSFRVLPDLTMVERAWPDGLRLRAVDSAATNGDSSLFLVRTVTDGHGSMHHCHCAHDAALPEKLLLHVDGNHVVPVPVDQSRGALLGVRAHAGKLEVWRLSPTHGAPLLQTPPPDPELDARGIAEHWLTTGMPLDAVEGVVFEGDQPLLLVSHKLAHWLVDTKGSLRPMPGGALSLWTPSFLRPPSSMPWREPFVNDNNDKMSVFAFVPGSSALAFTRGASTSDLDPLIVTHGDEPGVFASTSAAGEHVEVKHIRRRVWVRAGGPVGSAWKPLAVSTSASDFVAYPVGKKWIALSEQPIDPATGHPAGWSASLDPDGELGEALAFTAGSDGALVRTDHDGTSSISTLAGAGPGFWVLLTALLVGSLSLLPLLVIRLRRRFSVDEDDVYVGFLRAAPGAVVTTSLGRAMVDAGSCRLATPRGVFELSESPVRPVRIDEGRDRPLIDGDAVYVVGRPLSHSGTDEAQLQQGGPWRAQQRTQLAQAGELYLIGRGGRQELARHVRHRFNQSLSHLVLLHLAASIFVFGLIHVRTFF